MRYFIKSYGCRLNQYYADYFINAVISSGAHVAKDESEADVVAIASCVVTHKAERDLRHYISHIKRTNPQAKIVVFGCYPKYKNLEDVYASGTVGEVIEKLKLHDPGFLIRPLFRVRVNIRIQEGCNFRCSYCVVPFVRGPSRSRSEDEILHEIKNVVENGAVEIVLTGIQTGEWGREWGKKLSQLIRKIKDQNPDLRIRLSSISPIHIKEDIIALLREGIILPHLHLPLQHGSRKVLKDMKRPYKLEYYLSVVHRLLDEVDNIAIGTDVIVGFPTETDEDFEESFKLINAIPYAYMHVFEFSPRKGTEAALLKPLKSDVVKQRKRRLLELAKVKKAEYLSRQIGRILTAVAETEEKDYYSLTADNYVKVYVKKSFNMDIGKVVKIMILEAMEDHVVGEPV
ncbi:MAG: MiaB/RimO family radical SAM methylthiotransferase [Candidatus Hydrothermia bacterium]